ncbi:MAG: hypothetical protein ACOX2Q_01790 [Dehalobacterium sp.]
MLRETKRLVAKRKSEGCIAVKMELAGVQAVLTSMDYSVQFIRGRRCSC